MNFATLPIEDVRRCAGDPRFVAVLAAFYDELGGRIAARGATCTNRGVCCKFGGAGHHLFVTSVELAGFLALAPPPLLAPPDRTFCPYQNAGICTARQARPAGCRVFFCDSASTWWQPQMTDWALHRLAAIGEHFGLAYAYVEWTEALRQLGGRLTPPQSPTGLVSLGIDSRSSHS